MEYLIGFAVCYLMGAALEFRNCYLFHVAGKSCPRPWLWMTEMFECRLKGLTNAQTE